MDSEQVLFRSLGHVLVKSFKYFKLWRGEVFEVVALQNELLVRAYTPISLGGDSTALMAIVALLQKLLNCAKKRQDMHNLGLF